MAKSFMDVVVMFSLVSLLVYSMMSFVIVFQDENGASSSILENPLINSTFIDLGDTISSQQAGSNTSQFEFDKDVPSPGFGSLIIFAIVGVAQSFTSLATGVWNIIIILPLSLLGVPSQVANILGTILSLTFMLLAWRVYRVGS